MHRGIETFPPSYSLPLCQWHHMLRYLTITEDLFCASWWGRTSENQFPCSHGAYTLREAINKINTCDDFITAIKLMCCRAWSSKTSQGKSNAKNPVFSLLYWEVSTLVNQMVKNLPAMQQTQVWSLGQKDPLEKGMAIQPTLAWKIPRTEEFMELQRIGLNWATNTVIEK